MSTKKEIQSQIKEAKIRRTLLLASVGTLRNKKPVQASQKAADARKEEALIKRLEEQLRGMS